MWAVLRDHREVRATRYTAREPRKLRIHFQSPGEKAAVVYAAAIAAQAHEDPRVRRDRLFVHFRGGVVYFGRRQRLSLSLLSN